MAHIYTWKVLLMGPRVLLDAILHKNHPFQSKLYWLYHGSMFKKKKNDTEVNIAVAILNGLRGDVGPKLS